MAQLGLTAANMSSQELVLEILKLKAANERALKGIENYQQQLYETKRELSTANAMEEHLASEIELLQSTDGSNRFTLKAEELAEQIHGLKQTNQENVELYECRLHEKQLQLQALTETLKTKEPRVDEGKIGQCAGEIASLEAQIAELTPVVTESEARRSEIGRINESLERKISETSGVLSELTECLSSKRQATADSERALQSLQEEIVVLQLALDASKQVPLAKAVKGNSLFAEVDDNRVKLQRHVQVVSEKYAALKLKYANKAQELRKLHSDYACLTRVLEDTSHVHEDQSELIEGYKNDSSRIVERITQLATELESLNAVDNNHLTRQMRCAEEMVFITRKKLLALLRELEGDSRARVHCEQQLFAAKQELVQCQSETVQLRIAGLMQEQTVEELRLRKTSVDNGTRALAPDPLQLGAPELTGDAGVNQTENKENRGGSGAQRARGGRGLAGKTKQVNFSEHVVEPRTTDRSRRRVLTVPCVHIPSIKRQP